MTVDGQSDETIRHLMTTTRRIALVGASMKPWRASHGVMRFLLDHGFNVTPVNPMLAGQTLHGRTVVAGLEDAAPLDMVDVFRNTSHVGALVDEAIRLGARSIWMQLGVVDQDAAERAPGGGDHRGNGSLPRDRGSPASPVCSLNLLIEPAVHLSLSRPRSIGSPLNQRFIDLPLNQRFIDLPLNQRFIDLPLNQRFIGSPLNRRRHDATSRDREF